MSKLVLNLNNSNFLDLVSKLQDLTSISDVIKLKIDKDNILAYSMLSNDIAVLSLKNYLLNTSEYITDFKSNDTFDYVIIGAPKFVKNLKFFNTDIPISLELNSKLSDDIMHIRSTKFTNGKLKISCIGGELSKIRDINKSALSARLNPVNSKWEFKISKLDFSNIKKLSSINSEDRVLTVNVDDGKVFLTEETKWELEVDETTTVKNSKIIFNKKYLSNISDDDNFIEFKVFETFILVSNTNSNLMISFETQFDD